LATAAAGTTPAAVTFLEGGMVFDLKDVLPKEPAPPANSETYIMRMRYLKMSES